jgi:signal transduction histidine kinase
VERPTALDERVRISELLDGESLDEMARSIAELHRLGVVIREPGGRVLASVSVAPVRESGGADHLHTEVYLHDGEPAAEITLGPFVSGDEERVRAITRQLKTLLGVVVHASYARHLTANLHLAAMEENFAELTEKNRRLDRALEQLREVDRLKSNFLATISHELRTPLTSVIGYTEMLLEGLAGNVSSAQRDFLETILSKAEQLLQLISGLLDVSLLESRSLRIDREPVSVTELCERVAQSMAAEAQRKRVAVSLSQAPVPRALGDAAKIRQVLLHLLANAIKFSREGGDVIVDIDVGPLCPEDRLAFSLAREQLSGRVGLRVRVRDTGIGIQQSQQARIFEPFFQVDSSTTREFGGTGLGLSLAKLYVEAHGGYIWVDSTLGKGSTFTITLPAVPEDLQAYVARRSGSQ